MSADADDSSTRQLLEQLWSDTTRIRPAVRPLPWGQLSPREKFHATYGTLPMLEAPPARADYPAGGRGMVDFEAAVSNWLDRHRADAHELLERTKRRPPDYGHRHDQGWLAFQFTEAMLSDRQVDGLKREYQKRYVALGRYAANNWLDRQVWGT